MVSMIDIESKVLTICGQPPAGDPASIRACAEDFRSDARQAAHLEDVLESGHRQLEYRGLAANRLANRVKNLRRNISMVSTTLLETATTLDAAADQLAADQQGHQQRVAATRAELIRDQSRSER